jgi:hypothetical protein
MVHEPRPNKFSRSAVLGVSHRRTRDGFYSVICLMGNETKKEKPFRVLRFFGILLI